VACAGALELVPARRAQNVPHVALHNTHKFNYKIPGDSFDVAMAAYTSALAAAWVCMYRSVPGRWEA
jgi:hypothetical protein